MHLWRTFWAFCLGWALVGAKKGKTGKTIKTTGFFVGQIPLGKFEYPDLKAVLKPQQARVICENDLECAGFTWKGAKILDIPHPITFFRYVSESTFTAGNNYQWTSYRVKRSFVVVAGKKFPDAKASETKFVLYCLAPYLIISG